MKSKIWLVVILLILFTTTVEAQAGRSPYAMERAKESAADDNKNIAILLSAIAVWWGLGRWGGRVI